MADSNRKRFQGPKGTRDFYPADMAWRRYLEDAWRRVSTRHGFEEIEGPTFESLDLYTVKSGEGIVSELFAFQDRGERDLALRPEFTPTLARMAVAQGASYSKPIKWFAIPIHYRAERPQRGRLREFIQWNVDLLGDESPQADCEVLGVAIDLLAELGLSRELVRVKVSHRGAVANFLRTLGLPDEGLDAAFSLLDKRDKIPGEVFQSEAGRLGLSPEAIERFDAFSRSSTTADRPWEEVLEHLRAPEGDLEDLQPLHEALNSIGLAGWCEYDLGIVRGLAYYTGMVFEIRDAGGAERAVAGGGRYDRLIETFGGQSMSACGFGMGDVVLSLILEDHGLKPDAEEILPAPDAFLISLGREDADRLLPAMLHELRSAGLHARRSYRSTRNLGKLLKEASGARTRFAIILGDELEGDQVVVKDLESGDQFELPVHRVAESLLTRLGRFGARGLD